MKKLLMVKLLFLSLIFSSCGKGTVEVTNESYEPRIVIEGYLFPHQKVERIWIMENFRLNRNLENTDIMLRDAEVKIIDENDFEYPLRFHTAQSGQSYYDNYFEYTGLGLDIEYGQSYTIDVTANIDGRQLQASSTTTVPQPGLEIVGINHDSLIYRQRDQNGDLMNFMATFERSPGTTFYVMTIKPVDPTNENFIYDNPFDDDEPESPENDMDYLYEYEWILDRPATAGQSEFEIYWFDLWFYTRYEIIIYAADNNYKEFLQTYDEVQEEDGNFHEAKFNIDGDGIGVFGSVVADTVYIEVLRP